MQDLDSRHDRLQHQITALPEHTQLQELSRHKAELDAQRRDLAIELEDAEREQKKADSDVEQVKARRKRDQDRIDAGQVTSPKDLQHMQDELVSLDRRIAELEDVEIEVMERVEDLQQRVAALDGDLARLNEEGVAATQRRDETTAGFQTELSDIEAQRAETVAGVPEDLLALYERLRAKKDGVGAAELRRGECGGCRLGIDNAELNSIKAAAEDEVVRCEECQRIMVRTAESGL